ncbi:MAG: hypothetical protein ACM3S4_00455 [Burkholderiales bacterium]
MPIDFEDKFSRFLTDYIKENEIDEDDLDDVAEVLYFDWMDEPKDWLDGKSPNTYFDSFGAASLIELLGEYVFAGMAIPAPLLNRIEDIKEETHPFLLSLLLNYEGEKSGELKTVIVQLIDEMRMSHPYDYYIKVIAESTEASDFPEACVQELKNTGDNYKEKIISAYENAQSDYSSDCFLDILSDLPYDERTYNYVLERFLYGDRLKAFYASCLGKLGNEDALPYLEQALKDEGLKYYDYMSIRDAYEELGGELNIERDFTGDSDYESLKNLED